MPYDPEKFRAALERKRIARAMKEKADSLSGTKDDRGNTIDSAKILYDENQEPVRVQFKTTGGQYTRPINEAIGSVSIEDFDPDAFQEALQKKLASKKVTTQADDVRRVFDPMATHKVVADVAKDFIDGEMPGVYGEAGRTRVIDAQIDTSKDGKPIGYTLIGEDGSARPFRISEDPNLVAAIQTLNKEKTDLLNDLNENAPSVPLTDRGAIGAKVTQAGREGYARETFGKNNIVVLPNERFAVIDPATGKVSLTDPDRFTDIGRDLVDIAPDVAEAIPGIVLSGLGSYVGARSGTPGATRAISAAGGAVGDVIGGTARQVVSSQLPGEDFPGATPRQELYERARMVGTSAAAGLGMEGLLAGVDQIRKVGPAQSFERSMGREVRGGKSAKDLQPEISRGIELEKEIGEPLSVGQLANTEAGAGLENALRRGSSADVIVENDIKRALALENHLNKTIDFVANNKNIGVSESSRRVISAFDDYISGLRELRKKQWEANLANVARSSGGAKIVDTSNTMRVIDDFLSEYSSKEVPGWGVSVDQDIFRKLTEMKKGLSEYSDNGAVSALQLNEMLKKATSDAGFIKDLDPKLNAVISNRIKKALQEDLAASAERSAAEGGGAAQALYDLRRDYAVMSEPIEQAKQQLFVRNRKLLNDPGTAAAIDKMPGQVLSNSQSPGQVKAFFDVLDKADPVASSQFKASVLEELLTNSKTRDGVFSPEMFMNKMRNPKVRAKVAAMYSGKDAKKIQDAFDYAARITKRGTAAGSSPTAPLTRIFGAIQVSPIIGSALKAPLERIQKAMVPLADPKNLAIVLNNDEGRDLFLKIARTPPKSLTKKEAVESFMRAAERLTVIFNRDRKLIYDQGGTQNE